MWTKEYTDFEVVKISNQQVKVYRNNQASLTINVGHKIKDARWSNNYVLVTLENGKIRKYSTVSAYINI